MSWLRTLLSTVALVALFALACPPSTMALEVHSGPGMAYDVVGTIAPGNYVVLAQEQEWYKIQLADGREGWILSTMVQPTQLSETPRAATPTPVMPSPVAPPTAAAPPALPSPTAPPTPAATPSSTRAPGALPGHHRQSPTNTYQWPQTPNTPTTSPEDHPRRAAARIVSWA